MKVWLALAIISCCGCEAIDDFSRFHFVDDDAGGAQDLSAPADAPIDLGRLADLAAATDAEAAAPDLSATIRAACTDWQNAQTSSCRNCVNQNGHTCIPVKTFSDCQCVTTGPTGCLISKPGCSELPACMADLVSANDCIAAACNATCD